MFSAAPLVGCILLNLRWIFYPRRLCNFDPNRIEIFTILNLYFVFQKKKEG